MTLATYSGLQGEIADFLDRSDLTSQIQSFIALAEASMNRRIRHWRMETRSQASVATQYADFPSDWLETIRYNIAGDRRMKLLSLAQMMDMRECNDNVSAKPRFYAHVGGEIEHYPTPDTTYTTELLYYARIPALSDENTGNWVLTYHPDAYLYGALLHSAPFLGEDPRLAVWGGLYADAIKGIDDEAMTSRHSGTGLARR